MECHGKIVAAFFRFTEIVKVDLLVACELMFRNFRIE